MNIRLCAYLCVFLSPAAILAQSTPESGAPPNPQIAPLGDFIALTKAYKYPPPKALTATSSAQDRNLAAFLAAAPRIERLDMVRTGDIRCETKSYTNGAVQQIYYQGAYTCTMDSTMPGRILVTAPWMLVAPDKPKPRSLAESGDFPELGWVTAAAFQGTSEQQGKKIFTYQLEDQEAEIDATTRLPLHAKLSAFEVWYTYPAPPTAKLVLPDKIAKKIHSVVRAWSGGPN